MASASSPRAISVPTWSHNRCGVERREHRLNEESPLSQQELSKMTLDLLEFLSGVALSVVNSACVACMKSCFFELSMEHADDCRKNQPCLLSKEGCKFVRCIGGDASNVESSIEKISSQAMKVVLEVEGKGRRSLLKPGVLKETLGSVCRSLSKGFDQRVGCVKASLRPVGDLSPDQMGRLWSNVLGVEKMSVVVVHLASHFEQGHAGAEDTSGKDVGEVVKRLNEIRQSLSNLEAEDVSTGSIYELLDCLVSISRWLTSLARMLAIRLGGAENSKQYNLVRQELIRTANCLQACAVEACKTVEPGSGTSPAVLDEATSRLMGDRVDWIVVWGASSECENFLRVCDSLRKTTEWGMYKECKNELERSFANVAKWREQQKCFVKEEDKVAELLRLEGFEERDIQLCKNGNIEAFLGEAKSLCQSGGSLLLTSLSSGEFSERLDKFMERVGPKYRDAYDFVEKTFPLMEALEADSLTEGQEHQFPGIRDLHMCLEGGKRTDLDQALLKAELRHLLKNRGLFGEEEYNILTFLMWSRKVGARVVKKKEELGLSFLAPRGEELFNAEQQVERLLYIKVLTFARRCIKESRDSGGIGHCIDRMNWVCGHLDAAAGAYLATIYSGWKLAEDDYETLLELVEVWTKRGGNFFLEAWEPIVEELLRAIQEGEEGNPQDRYILQQKVMNGKLGKNLGKPFIKKLNKNGLLVKRPEEVVGCGLTATSTTVASELLTEPSTQTVEPEDATQVADGVTSCFNLVDEWVVKKLGGGTFLHNIEEVLSSLSGILQPVGQGGHGVDTERVDQKLRELGEAFSRLVEEDRDSVRDFIRFRLIREVKLSRSSVDQAKWLKNRINEVCKTRSNQGRSWWSWFGF